ncbi:MAG: ribosomal RNA small subunit methyltransferase A [Spirochaetia bacterium]|nr:MAG: ribosomal RNA small subunit methyltransferase A [Spirochaetia bacterium]
MGTYLGQNFLMNKFKLRKIADVLELEKGDTVIEIGPGHGELTLLLAKNFQFSIFNFQIIAIEKDEQLAKDLKNRIHDLGLGKNIEIIEGDALKILPALNTKYKIQNTKYKLVGNIPYYITGYLLRILGELELKPNLIILTIQKEVAQRIAAKPPKMNLLAASVQFWAKPKIIGYISRKDFRPAPKVDSAIIKFNIKTSDVSRTSDVQKLKYYKLIKVLFKQPRKTILNNLKSSAKGGSASGGQISNLKNDEFLKKIAKAGVNPFDRPQNLTIEQIKNLSI